MRLTDYEIKEVFWLYEYPDDFGFLRYIINKNHVVIYNEEESIISAYWFEVDDESDCFPVRMQQKESGHIILHCEFDEDDGVQKIISHPYGAITSKEASPNKIILHGTHEDESFYVHLIKKK